MRDKHFILTIDVEEFFQSENLRGAYPIADWDRTPSRVVEQVETLLNLLLSENVGSATFFILGFVAKRYPKLVKRIADEGFEVASHGMMHTLNTEMTSPMIASDFATSKKMLEDICGCAVVGYRAPSFTIDAKCIEELRAQGYHYDSSFNDIAWHDRYGRLDLSEYVKVSSGVFRHPAGDFHEFPISNLQVGSRTLPWGGGGYFRLLPGVVHRAGVMKALRRESHFNFYTHPWEYDPQQPRAEGLGAATSFRHYVGLSRTQTRLIKLIRMLKAHDVQIVGVGDILPR